MFDGKIRNKNTLPAGITDRPQLHLKVIFEFKYEQSMSRDPKNDFREEIQYLPSSVETGCLNFSCVGE